MKLIGLDIKIFLKIQHSFKNIVQVLNLLRNSKSNKPEDFYTISNFSF